MLTNSKTSFIINSVRTRADKKYIIKGDFKMSKFQFTVFYKKDAYNQHKTYYQNQNRYAGCKSFVTLEEAIAFAKTVKNASIHHFWDTSKKIAF